jgi:hypothetical protein
MENRCSDVPVCSFQCPSCQTRCCRRRCARWSPSEPGSYGGRTCTKRHTSDGSARAAESGVRLTVSRRRCHIPQLQLALGRCTSYQKRHTSSPWQLTRPSPPGSQLARLSAEGPLHKIVECHKLSRNSARPRRTYFNSAIAASSCDFRGAVAHICAAAAVDGVHHGLVGLYSVSEVVEGEGSGVKWWRGREAE